MLKAFFYCALYALLNVSGTSLIKWNLKGKLLSSLTEWINLFLNFKVITALGLIFISMLIVFKALSTANFTFVIPVSTGINFILTIIVGYYVFKDPLNFISFLGFGLIISGIILLSINSLHHAK
jgi:multidrug transporter EmrE-like cation transporter